MAQAASALQVKSVAKSSGRLGSGVPAIRGQALRSEPGGLSPATPPAVPATAGFRAAPVLLVLEAGAGGKPSLEGGIPSLEGGICHGK
mmetsp:Transcript_14845/g.42572  ORF Transcript_14845/g.42572 Transcript_14845/m.42572 type:complete len:88 (+) Transcript_14845:1185-1448(+)